MAVIMIADDDVLLAENLKEFLESRGHRVNVVHDGVAASEKAQEWGPQLILMDIMMPGAYGSSVYVSLDNAGIAKKTGFVFITSLPLDKVKTRLPTDHPRTRLLGKPIDFGQLEAAVQELLAKAG